MSGLRYRVGLICLGGILALTGCGKLGTTSEATPPARAIDLVDSGNSGHPVSLVGLIKIGVTQPGYDQSPAPKSGAGSSPNSGSSSGPSGPSDSPPNPALSVIRSYNNFNSDHLYSFSLT